MGPALRQAWVGYRLRLDTELARAGFADQALPDGRLLRICARESDVTISQIGRQLNITRQGAGKIVASLQERGYVTLSPSPHSGREKLVQLTPRAHEYLRAFDQAARRIEREVEAALGDQAVEAVHAITEFLRQPSQPRLSDYLRRGRDLDDLKYEDSGG